MALHGLVEVNEQPIGAWSATRKHLTSKGVGTYEWTVELHGHTTRGTLTHTYTDGAAVLASMVLAAGAAQLANQKRDTP